MADLGQKREAARLRGPETPKSGMRLAWAASPPRDGLGAQAPLPPTPSQPPQTGTGIGLFCTAVLHIILCSVRQRRGRGSHGLLTPASSQRQLQPRRKTNLVHSDACRRPLVERFKKFYSICNIYAGPKLGGTYPCCPLPPLPAPPPNGTQHDVQQQCKKDRFQSQFDKLKF